MGAPDHRGLDGAAALLAKASFDKGVSEALGRMVYPATLDSSRLQFPEPLVSLFHHPVYETLSDEQKWRLGLLETINFFSLNIHGERALVRDLVGRLYKKTPLGGSRAVNEYLQHFIHEENAHTFMLAGYCHRFGEGVMQDLSVTVDSPALSPVGDELLAFGRTLILESFLDYLNCAAMRDDGLDPTVRDVHRFHHIDEARHMSFDKEVVKWCVGVLQAEGKEDELKAITSSLLAYGSYAFRRLASASVYKAIGIAEATEVVWEVAAEPRRLAISQDWLSSGRRFLQKVGLNPIPPQS
jgi:hypothetical protein